MISLGWRDTAAPDSQAVRCSGDAHVAPACGHGRCWQETAYVLQPAANGLTNGERSYVLYCSDTCVACSDGLLALNKLSVADERCAIFLRATASSGPGFHFLAKI